MQHFSAILCAVGSASSIKLGTSMLALKPCSWGLNVHRYNHISKKHMCSTSHWCSIVQSCITRSETWNIDQEFQEDALTCKMCPYPPWCVYNPQQHAIPHGVQRQRLAYYLDQIPINILEKTLRRNQHFSDCIFTERFVNVLNRVVFVPSTAFVMKWSIPSPNIKDFFGKTIK